MRVTNVQELTTQGPRDSQQDAMRSLQSADGAYYAGIFDGHGRDGKEISISSSQVIPDIATMAKFEPRHDVLNRGNILRQMMMKKSREIAARLLHGGTTATVAVFKESELAVAYLGDSEAFFYPDQGEAIALTDPHTARNQEEVARVKGLGYEIATYGGTKYFGGRLMVSRGIGDDDCGFVSNVAEITYLELPSPGTLVEASDGIWQNSHNEVEQAVRNEAFTDGFLEMLADRNQDNATAIIARIEG